MIGRRMENTSDQMFRFDSSGVQNYMSSDQKFPKVIQHRSANSHTMQLGGGPIQLNNDSLEKMPFPICQEESFIEPD